MSPFRCQLHVQKRLQRSNQSYNFSKNPEGDSDEEESDEFEEDELLHERIYDMV